MGKKRKSKKKPAKKKSSWLGRLLILGLVILGVIGSVYYFGSFETRAKMERLAADGLNEVRTQPQLPGPLAKLLDAAYDQIPTTTGLIVEGGELGRDPDSPFLAGVPNSRFPIRPLLQSSYVNLFNDRRLQTACLAVRLKSSNSEKSKTDIQMPMVDSRAPQLTESAMTAGQWSPKPIIPPKILSEFYGEPGAREAALAGNHAPMTQPFFEGPWREAIHTFTSRYPARFDEIWLYIGPVYRTDSSKLSSGVAIPDAFYLVALDLTDAGGLRALALLIPTAAESLDLNQYLTSIRQIENLTGLQFLPELDYSYQETLSNYVSPTVW